MKSILTAFAENTVFANIILILVFLSGYIAVSSMIKEVYPELSLGLITISIPYPGGDPGEIEESICLKLEEAIDRIEGVGQYTTKAVENLGTASIEVKTGYDIRKVLDTIRVEVESIDTFPAGAEKPVIKEFLFKEPVLQLSVSGRMSERRLKSWAQSLKDEVRRLPDVSQVEIFGTRDYEIDIEVSEKQLQKFGLTFDAVSKAVSQSCLNLSGGSIKTAGEEIRIRTIGRKYNGTELGSIVVFSDERGRIVTLDRIADIKDGFSEDSVIASVNGNPSLMLIINKTNEEDIIAISEQVNQLVKEKHEVLPEGVELKVLYDNTEKLRARLSLLTKNGIMGMIVVFILLWFFLNAKLSFWAGMGIPISIAGALTIVWGLGGTINMISLFGLIMVLGIVVDDAIIVGEAIYVHKKMGKTGLEAAVDGVREVGMPVVAAIATTIVAFLPLLFVDGVMGKLIAILPVIVISCLLVSLVECLLILPAHLSSLSDSDRPPTGKFKGLKRLFSINQRVSGIMETFIETRYKPFLSMVLRWRYIAVSIAIAVFFITIGVVKGGLLKFEVFPEIDGYIITAEVEFPEGTSHGITKQAVRKIEKALWQMAGNTKTTSGQPLVRDCVSLVGQTFGGRGVPDKGSHFGSVQAILLKSELRGIHTKDIIVGWENETGKISGAKSLSFQGMKAGPPGEPVEIWLQGNHIETLVEAGKELMAILGQFEGVFQIHSDFSKGKKELKLSLKPEARAYGLTVDDLARQIHAGFYGYEAVRLQRGHDDIRVKVLYTAEERSRLENLENVRIRTRTGNEIPLRAVANYKLIQGQSTITRTNGSCRIAVFAGVDTARANAGDIFEELAAVFLPELKQKYPGITIALQGEQKKMRDSLGSLVIGFPLALLGVFIIIATTFRSYIQPLIILVTVPFGITGAVIGHLVLGYDLSIMSIFGMVALTGVVVNDAIVYIEKVNENLASGMRFYQAVIQGASRRFMAIFLTTISTVGGLMPLILETDFQAVFLIPMALSIASGVAFATILTLVLVPCLIVVLNDLRCSVHRMTKGAWPQRESVEPSGIKFEKLNPVLIDKEYVVSKAGGVEAVWQNYR